VKINKANCDGEQEELRMNAYDKGNELARALKESDEYRALGKARRELDTDSGARDMVKDFLRKQMEMQLEVMSGKADAKAKQDSLQKLYELLSLNSRARDYVAAFMRFQQVMQDIYKMIGDAVGEGLDPFAEKK
jgi:cell fate (sporulation/competence/biofilm development) regulator YlbF (YheA/YmcA/DUF963 family)